MTQAYGVLNPQQLIDLFQMRARSLDLVPSVEAKAKADVWREAAELLRNTEFVGWKDKVALGGIDGNTGFA
jgi:hypothetical protein